MSRNNDTFADFQNELIAETIDWARSKCEFFESLYSGISTPQSISDLSRLPISTKDAIRKAGWAARAKGLNPAIRQHTTGSTENSLELFRSQEELDFITRFFTAVNSPHSNTLRPLVLALVSQGHGSLVALPSAAFVIHGNVHDQTFLDKLASKILVDKHHIPGVQHHISALSGFTVHVALLTCVLLERGFLFDSTSVSNISTTGSLLTSTLRHLIESCWSVTITNRFSMTEAFGGATYCSTCKAWHFDPEVIPEVVHPVTQQNIYNDTGLLIVTSLFPFTQLQPCIRYKTGDVARIVPTKCKTVRQAIKIEGRLAHSWCRSNGEIILASGHILEVLEGEPLVAKEPVFRDILSRYPIVRELGFPRAMFSTTDNGRAILKIACRFNPLMYPSEAAALKERIEGKLFHFVAQGFQEFLEIIPVGPSSSVDGYRVTYV